MAAPTFVDADIHTSFGNGTSFVFDWGTVTGEADNDVAFVYIYKESTTAYTATPSGWAQVTGFPVDVDTGGFRYRADLWWRRRSGDTGTATWSWSGSTWRGSAGAVWRGAITTETPIVTVSLDEETAQNTQPSNPGLTVARANSALLFFIWNFAGATSSAPTGFAERLDADAHVFDDLTVTTGATGAVASTLTDAEYAFSALLELASEAAGGGSITGTGSVTIGAPALSGSGTFTTTGTGAVAIDAPALSGSGTAFDAPVSGTGAVAIGAPSLAGSGTFGTIGTGAVSIGAPALSASGTAFDGPVSGTGAVAIAAPSLSGSGTFATTGTGAVSIAAPALAGSGTAFDAAIDGSGALTIATPALSGSGTAVDAGSGFGAITIAGPALSASGTFTTVGSGSISIEAPSLAGSGTILGVIDGTGAVTILAPSLAAAGSFTTVGTGGITIGPPVLAGFEIVQEGPFAGYAVLTRRYGYVTVGARPSSTAALSRHAGYATIEQPRAYAEVE